MKLDGLVALYKSMKNQDIDRYRFEYSHARALFDIFFFIDENPFILFVFKEPVEVRDGVLAGIRYVLLPWISMDTPKFCAYKIRFTIISDLAAHPFP